MIQIGKFNELKFTTKTPAGLILSHQEQEVLLPFIDAPENIQPDDILHVFVYMHSDGRLMATIKTPLAQVGEFASLTVIDINEQGAFLDLGIDKDVFVPEREQKRPMRMGDKYVVYVYLNENNSRLEATSRIAGYINQAEFDLEVGDEVNLMITDPGDLGYNAIINKKYAGILYHNELYERLHHGEVRKGYIKKIREENKIDLSLRPIGYTHILDTKESLLSQLEESNGVLTLGDKSSPEEIYRRLKISKKAFKKTIGALYKDRLIEIFDFEIKKVKIPISEMFD
jgi:hypothetical protein